MESETPFLLFASVAPLLHDHHSLLSRVRGTVSAFALLVISAVGTYASGVGSGGCTDCPTGTYADSTGATVCVQCPSGTFQDATKQSACKPCATGLASSGAGKTVCDSCAAGYYSAATAQQVNWAVAEMNGLWVSHAIAPILPPLVL